MCVSRPFNLLCLARATTKCRERHPTMELLPEEELKSETKRHKALENATCVAHLNGNAGI